MSNVLERHVSPVARELLEHFPALIIEGARQVGKSTLATELTDDSATIVTLDDDDVRAAAAADSAGFVAQGGAGTMVIDEIQKMPELTLAVKASIDRDRRPGRFILTGSSSLLHVRGTADSLAGRAARLTLYGFSRGEVGGTMDDFAAAVLDNPNQLISARSNWSRADYADMLATGTYPEVRDMSPRIRDAWMESYLQGIVGRDMSEMRRSVEPARVSAVLRTIAGRQSAELVKAKLAEDTSVPPRTITGYLDLVHDVGLVANLPPWTSNLVKREIGRSKTFVIDSGLAMWLARMTPEQLIRLEYGEAFGSFLEGFVAAELLRQRAWSNERYDVYHWRNRDNDEVDVVLELGDGSIIAIEVKSAISFNSKQFKGLVKLRDILGSRFVAGVVLNTGNAGYRYADRLYGAPTSTLWELAATRW